MSFATLRNTVTGCAAGMPRRLQVRTIPVTVWKMLRVRLTVADDLEPAWSVIKNDEDDGVAFRASDRAKVAVSLIGAISDRHLTWSRGSILSQSHRN
jgi:hypothetical protein